LLIIVVFDPFPLLTIRIAPNAHPTRTTKVFALEDVSAGSRASNVRISLYFCIGFIQEKNT
jgi:hypothetical protein